MKKISMFKKSLVFATVIVALGASTAFAMHHNSKMDKPMYRTQNKQMLMQHKKYKVSPVATLAKLVNKPIKAVVKELRMEYLDSYQYAKMHGVLNKYKVERMFVAKENVKRAVATGRISSFESKKVLDKINDNIVQEKPEMTAVYCKMKPMKMKKMDKNKDMKMKDNKNEGRYYDFKYHDNFGANVMNMDE
jgi:hypothetical protein